MVDDCGLHSPFSFLRWDSNNWFHCDVLLVVTLWWSQVWCFYFNNSNKDGWKGWYGEQHWTWYLHTYNCLTLNTQGNSFRHNAKTPYSHNITSTHHTIKLSRYANCTDLKWRLELLTSTSLTRVPLASPPIEGLHDISPMLACIIIHNTYGTYRTDQIGWFKHCYSQNTYAIQAIIWVERVSPSLKYWWICIESQLPVWIFWMMPHTSKQNGTEPHCNSL